MANEDKSTPNPIDSDKELKTLQAAADNLRLLELRLGKLLNAQRDALIIKTKGNTNDGEPKP